MSVNPGKRRVKRRATLKDVAAEVGVSPATVSNAYNRPEQLSGELRVKVMEAARLLGYAGPDPTARGLRRGKVGAIGVLCADRLSYAFADPAAVLFFEGVSRVAGEAGLALLLVPGSVSGSHDPEAVRGAAVDGFVVYCMAEDDRMIEAVRERRLPAVFVDDPPKASA
jgi:DNA-binding LacI/PurR family transcriptional regulator